MSKFGFEEKWHKWIEQRISSTSLSILINGSATEEIFPQKSLRQGDLFHPFC